jgi:hypothetical protein
MIPKQLAYSRCTEEMGRWEAAASAYQRYQRILRQELHVAPPLSLMRHFEPDAATGRIPPTDRLVAFSQLTLHLVDWAVVCSEPS